MRNSYFIYKNKRFTWDMDNGLRCDGKDGLAELEQMIGIRFSANERNWFMNLLHDDVVAKSNAAPSFQEISTVQGMESGKARKTKNGEKE